MRIPKAGEVYPISQHLTPKPEGNAGSAKVTLDRNESERLRPDACDSGQQRDPISHHLTPKPDGSAGAVNATLGRSEPSD